MKKKITESQLRSIIAESVKKVLKEAYNPQDDIDAKEFMSWAMNSRSDVMQNIYGYYQASREGNESDANWYMDKILFAYADEKGCEESQLNTNAIEKAINEWGYYNYQEDDSLNEGVYNPDCRPRIVQRIKEVRRDLDFLEMVVKQKEVDGNGELIDDSERYSMTELLKNIKRDFELLFVGCGISPRHL